MDYEKKYNEALERARALWQEAIEKEYPNDYLKDYETIFPELRESEDERMMREFNDWLCEEIECRTNDLRDEEDRRTLNMLCYILQKVKDWLDKQKEQKQTDLPAGFYYIDLNGNRYYSKEFRYGDMKLKVGEQKPAECIEDSVKFEEGFKAGRESGLRDGQKYVLNYLDSYGLCKPAEWSEEDDGVLGQIITAFHRMANGCEHYFSQDTARVFEEFLKSLRPSWKPSEEQMDILDKVYHYLWADRNATADMQDGLGDLIDELKELCQ